MGAVLDALHRLQEVELQIADINRAIARKAQAVRRQQQAVATIDAQIASLQLKLRSEQMDADRLDLDVKSREAEIAKLRQALNAAKTNKEYSAILMQLNTTKADNSKIEEAALQKMGQVDARRKEIAALQEQRAAETAKVDEFLSAQKAVEAQSKDRLDGLNAQRTEAADGIPAGVLDMFNRVAAKNDGEAMARIIRTNPKRDEYACQGCNMSVTVQQVNALLSRDEAVKCNVCGRILYLETGAAASR